MYKKFVAIDQYGDTKFVNHPRKDLTEYYGVKHADKMYCDDPDGTSRHVGYVVAGHWYEILEISAWHKRND